MSVRVMSWVFDHSRARPIDRLLLLAIADCSSADGTNAWPSIGELSRKTGMSERAIYSSITRLVDLGELVRDKTVQRRRRNAYTIPMTPAPRAGSTPEHGSGEQDAPLHDTQSDPEQRAGMTLHDTQVDPAPRAGDIEEEPSRTVNGTVNEPSSALARRDDPDVAVESTTAQTIVAEWIDRCRKRPPKNVIGQVSKHTKALLEEGIDPDDIRRGLAAWMTKDRHPSTLPSIVNSVMNSGGPSARPSTTDQRVQAGLDLAAKYAERGE